MRKNNYFSTYEEVGQECIINFILMKFDKNINQFILSDSNNIDYFHIIKSNIMSNMNAIVTEVSN
jgi:hypothetical protein